MIERVTEFGVQTLNLPFDEIQKITGWSVVMVNDYLTNKRNFDDFAVTIDFLLDEARNLNHLVNVNIAALGKLRAKGLESLNAINDTIQLVNTVQHANTRVKANEALESLIEANQELNTLLIIASKNRSNLSSLTSRVDRFEILPLGLYAAGAHVVPDGLTFDYFDTITIVSAPTSGQASNTVIVTSELVDAAPVSWSARAYLDSTIHATITATSATQFSIAITGAARIKQIYGNLKGS